MTRGVHDPSRKFRRQPAKRAASVSIDGDLLSEAKAMGINLSQTLEAELRKRVQSEKNRRWKDESQPSIESYNRLIERAGVFGEELLDFDDDPAV